MTDGALRVLTLNTGLLRVRVLGRTLLEVPHLDERLRVLPAMLAATGADVLCLQEVFWRGHRQALVDDLRATHPHVARCDDGWRPFTHGLLVASRVPMRDAAFTRFEAVQAWQRVLVPQGVLSVSASVPGFGEVRFLNLHTTAGGGSGGPEDPTIEQLRDRQLDQASALGLSSGLPALLCGDLNTGPEASPDNLRGLLARGWTDPVAGGTTWDPASALNRGGLFDDSPAQRVDHVLLSPSAAASMTVEHAGVVLDGAVVHVAGDVVGVSDHAGVLVTLAPT